MKDRYKRKKVPKRIAQSIKTIRAKKKKHIDILQKPKRCRYCKGRVKLETFQHGQFGQKILSRYKCRKCSASVNCHAGTDLPMGILADRELRRLRAEAHNAMNWKEILWKEKQRQYKEFAEHFGWKRRFHIGMLNKRQARELINYIKENYGDSKH